MGCEGWTEGIERNGSELTGGGRRNVKEAKWSDSFRESVEDERPFLSRRYMKAALKGEKRGTYPFGQGLDPHFSGLAGIQSQ